MKKAFAGVSHSSEGSGATAGYQYLDIRAKRLKGVMSPYPMVKDVTTASSDSEDEVFASSDPKGPGLASSDTKDKVSASPDP